MEASLVVLDRVVRMSPSCETCELGHISCSFVTAPDRPDKMIECHTIVCHGLACARYKYPELFEEKTPAEVAT